MTVIRGRASHSTHARRSPYPHVEVGLLCGAKRKRKSLVMSSMYTAAYSRSLSIKRDFTPKFFFLFCKKTYCSSPKQRTISLLLPMHTYSCLYFMHHCNKPSKND